MYFFIIYFFSFFKMNQFCVQDDPMNVVQAQPGGSRQSPEVFAVALQAPRLSCDTSNRVGHTCSHDDPKTLLSLQLCEVALGLVLQPS